MVFKNSDTFYEQLTAKLYSPSHDKDQSTQHQHNQHNPPPVPKSPALKRQNLSLSSQDWKLLMNDTQLVKYSAGQSNSKKKKNHRTHCFFLVIVEEGMYHPNLLQIASGTVRIEKVNLFFFFSGR